MNNDRRRSLDICIYYLDSLTRQLDVLKQYLEVFNNLKNNIDKASAKVQETLDKLEIIHKEEYNAYRSLPENLSLTQMALDMEFALSDIEDAMQKVKGLFDYIDTMENVYYTQFMNTYNPSVLIEQIEKIKEAISLCNEDIESAKVK